MGHSLWDKIIPRFVTTSAFAYLIYTLGWQGKDFSYLHFLTFALIVVLVLVPFVRRIKLPNLIDLETKMESLREETKIELANIRNQISTTWEARISPVQHQWNITGMDEPSMKVLSKLITEDVQPISSLEINDKEKYTRNQFLRKADAHRLRVFTTLFLARPIQIALKEKRPFNKEDMASYWGSGNIDDKINYMVSQLLNGGVELFTPPSEVAEISEGLKSVKDLLEIRNKVNNKEIAPPDQQEAEELFNKTSNAIRGIISGVTLIEWQAILYQVEMMQKIKELYESIDTINDSPSKD